MSDPAMLARIQSFLTSGDRNEPASSEERSAWEDFFSLEDHIIRAIARRGDVSQSDVDDVAQEVWALLVRRLPTFRLDPARGSLNAWVAAVARHLVGRHERRRKMRRDAFLALELAADFVDPKGDPVTDAARKLQQEQVQAAITKLAESIPELKRRIIIRYWVDEQPLSAIAAELEVSEDRVWTIIRCARPRLRKLLGQARLGAEL
jgi:RNA polymerase sigma factor (sigma-70 family)